MSQGQTKARRPSASISLAVSSSGCRPASGQRDMPAGLRKRERRRPADADAGAGDQSEFFFGHGRPAFTIARADALDLIGQGRRIALASGLFARVARPRRSVAPDVRRQPPDQRAEHQGAADNGQRSRDFAEGKKTQSGPSTTSSMLISPVSAAGICLAPSMNMMKATQTVARPKTASTARSNGVTAGCGERLKAKAAAAKAPSALIEVIDMPGWRRCSTIIRPKADGHHEAIWPARSAGRFPARSPP